MKIDRGLQIERDGDTLTIRAQNSLTRWLGALFAGIGLGLMAAAYTHTGHVSRPWIVVLCGALSAVCGTFLIVPQVCTTIFDSRSRQIVCITSVYNRAPRTQRYSFENIAGMVLNKDKFISHCSPYLELKESGGRLLLCPNNGFVGVSAGVSLLEAICATTGLPVLDLESWF